MNGYNPNSMTIARVLPTTKKRLINTHTYAHLEKVESEINMIDDVLSFTLFVLVENAMEWTMDFNTTKSVIRRYSCHPDTQFLF